MDGSKETDPLIEWNRLNIENAEQGFVSSLYKSLSETTTFVDKFSVWILAGSGASGALLISQIDSVLPLLSVRGLQSCIGVLVLSAICGFIAKYYSLRCEIQNKTQSKMEELIIPIMKKFEEDEQTIQQYASERDIKLQTEISLETIMNEFARPFPRFVKWMIERKIRQTSGDRQAGHHAAVKAYASQLRWTFTQIILFICFLIIGAGFATPL